VVEEVRPNPDQYLTDSGETTDPYTDPGGGAGIGLPPGWQVFPSVPPRPAPTGPARASSYYNGSKPSSAPPPPPDPWAGISSAVHSAAANLVDKFEALIGGAGAGFDSEGLALKLAKADVNLTTNSAPLDAFQWLYDTQLNAQRQAEAPWAQFGMDEDLYKTTVAKMNASYFDWTGDQMSPDGGAVKGSGMWQAIREQWSPDEMRNFAMFGNPQGTGQMLANAQFSGADPWLSAGQTYTQTLEQFQQVEEHAPTDKATLAAFWRFGVGAKQIGSGTEATGTLAQKSLFTGTTVR
jgi:hypothetical protein